MCIAVHRDFLLKSLRETGNEVTQHGAALGLGIARLGARDEEVFEDLKNVLYTDSAVAGEVTHTSMAGRHVLHYFLIQSSSCLPTAQSCRR